MCRLSCKNRILFSLLESCDLDTQCSDSTVFANTLNTMQQSFEESTSCKNVAKYTILIETIPKFQLHKR